MNSDAFIQWACRYKHIYQSKAVHCFSQIKGLTHAESSGGIDTLSCLVTFRSHSSAPSSEAFISVSSPSSLEQKHLSFSLSTQTHTFTHPPLLNGLRWVRYNLVRDMGEPIERVYYHLYLFVLATKISLTAAGWVLNCEPSAYAQEQMNAGKRPVIEYVKNKPCT